MSNINDRKETEEGNGNSNNKAGSKYNWATAISIGSVAVATLGVAYCLIYYYNKRLSQDQNQTGNKQQQQQQGGAESKDSNMQKVKKYNNDVIETIEESENEPKRTKYYIHVSKDDGKVDLNEVKEVARRIVKGFEKYKSYDDFDVDKIGGGITNILYKVSIKKEALIREEEKDIDVGNQSKSMTPIVTSSDGGKIKTITMEYEKDIDSILVKNTITSDDDDDVSKKSKSTPIALVRVYGENTEVVIHRSLEIKLLFALSKLGFSPTLYGLYDNGRVEGYIENTQSITPQDMSRPDVQGMVAIELAKMHSLGDLINEPMLIKAPQVWSSIDKYSKMAFSITFPEDQEKARLYRSLGLHSMLQEIRWLQSQLPSLKNQDGAQIFNGGLLGLGQDDNEESRFERIARAILFEPVLCHNDLLYGNILLLPKENPPRAQLIDFEYGCYNYRGYDIANHFCEYAGFDADFAKWYPSQEQKIHFIKEYIRAVANNPNKRDIERNPAFAEAAAILFPDTNATSSNSTSRYQDDPILLLNRLAHWVDRFALASHLFWGFWAIIQAKHSTIDFNFIEYSGLRFKGYFMHKEKFFPGVILRAIQSPAKVSPKKV